MMATIDIEDALLRRSRALATRRGIRLQQLIVEALAAEVGVAVSNDGPGAAPARAGWRALSGQLRVLRPETARILELIEIDSE